MCTGVVEVIRRKGAFACSRSSRNRRRTPRGKQGRNVGSEARRAQVERRACSGQGRNFTFNHSLSGPMIGFAPCHEAYPLPTRPRPRLARAHSRRSRPWKNEGASGPPPSPDAGHLAHPAADASRGAVYGKSPGSFWFTHLMAEKRNLSETGGTIPRHQGHLLDRLQKLQTEARQCRSQSQPLSLSRLNRPPWSARFPTETCCGIARCSKRRRSSSTSSPSTRGFSRKTSGGSASCSADAIQRSPLFLKSGLKSAFFVPRRRRCAAVRPAETPVRRQ